MSTAFFEHVAADPIVSKEFTDEQLRHFFSELEAPVSYPEEFLRHIDEAGFDGIGDFLVHYTLGDLDTVEDLDDFLAHYGVKGMKWGKLTDRTKTLPIGGEVDEEKDLEKELNDIVKDISSKKLTKTQITEYIAKNPEKAETELYWVNGDAYKRSDIPPKMLERIDTFVKKANKKLQHSSGSDRDDFLAHYGIMGMKWGVRNAESSRRTGKPKSNKPRVSSKSSDKKSSKSNRLSDNPKNRRMTDAELKATVARLRLERELSDLRPRELASNNRVREMLKDVAFDVVKGASTEAGKAILAHVLKTQYNNRAKGDFKLPAGKKK